jgi:hypothetical protein
VGGSHSALPMTRTWEVDDSTRTRTFSGRRAEVLASFATHRAQGDVAMRRLKRPPEAESPTFAPRPAMSSCAFSGSNLEARFQGPLPSARRSLSATPCPWPCSLGGRFQPSTAWGESALPGTTRAFTAAPGDGHANCLLVPFGLARRSSSLKAWKVKRPRTGRSPAFHAKRRSGCPNRRAQRVVVGDGRNLAGSATFIGFRKTCP